MLTQKQRSDVLRVLVKAYYAYRDKPLLKVCRSLKIGLLQQEDEEFGGEYEKVIQTSFPADEWILEAAKKEKRWRRVRELERHKERLARYRHYIIVPGEVQTDYKEHVFWHEFGHLWLETLRLMPRFIGYQGHLQQFDEDGAYWTQERLCEAFANAMMLYRRGLVGEIMPDLDLETFFFADESSIGYAEVAGFSVRLVMGYVQKTEREQRNVDLRGLKEMLLVQERFIAHTEFQQQLPMMLMDHHQSPGIRWYDEEKDLEYRMRFCRRPSWTPRLKSQRRSRLASYVEPQLYLPFPWPKT